MGKHPDIADIRSERLPYEYGAAASETEKPILPCLENRFFVHPGQAASGRNVLDGQQEFGDVCRCIPGKPVIFEGQYIQVTGLLQVMLDEKIPDGCGQVGIPCKKTRGKSPAGIPAGRRPVCGSAFLLP